MPLNPERDWTGRGGSGRVGDANGGDDAADDVIRFGVNYKLHIPFVRSKSGDLSEIVQIIWEFCCSVEQHKYQ